MHAAQETTAPPAWSGTQAHNIQRHSENLEQQRLIQILYLKNAQCLKHDHGKTLECQTANK